MKMEQEVDFSVNSKRGPMTMMDPRIETRGSWSRAIKARISYPGGDVISTLFYRDFRRHDGTVLARHGQPSREALAYVSSI